MIPHPRIGRRAATTPPRSGAFLRWRRGVVVGLLVASVLASAVGPGSTPVEAVEPYGWAYLLANQPTPLTGSYTPIRVRQFNSTGDTNSNRAINTVVRTGVGAYTARLPNLGAAAGNVHVTAVGSLIAGDPTSGPGSCQVANWRLDGTTQQVNVRCFSFTGAPKDGAFALTYANLRSSQQPAAYLRADRPVTSSYTPNLAYQFNSSRTPNTVVRTGVGAYTARLPNIGTDGTAHVQVTPYGLSHGRCQVAGWGRVGTAQEVRVRCFNSAGLAANHQFTLSYVSGTNLVASPWRSSGSGTASAYVFAHQPTVASYTPRSFYRFNSSGGTNTITRSSVGTYRVNFPGQALDRGTVQVSTFGTQPAQCKVETWGPTGGVQVRCFNPSGRAKDAAFTATVLASTGLLRQRLAIPSYFRPNTMDDDDQLLWPRMGDGVPTVGLAIINPNSGPGSRVDQEYLDQTKHSQEKGLIVLGYVDTDYGDETSGQSPREEVKERVNRYYDWYGVDGIFFDQAFSSDCGKLEYYREIYNHVKSKTGKRMVVINPGTHTQECYMRTADIVVNFESYWVAPPAIPPATMPFLSYAPGTANSWQLPVTAWEWKYPAERFWHIVHTTTSEADMQNAIRLSKQRNAGWIYVTDDVLTDDPATATVECDMDNATPIERCNPWNELPPRTYWSIEMGRAKLL